MAESIQTEQAFNLDAEGRRRRADRERKATTLKDAATFVASATPIIGDVMAAKEVYDELQKDDPNYYLAGALGGAAIVGLVPGLGDAAASAIRAGARKALDIAKRVEVDPTALGSMGGNIRLKPKEDVTPQISNIDYQKKMSEFDKAETADEWQKSVNNYVENSRNVSPTIRTPELESSAKDLLDGKITREQHLDNVDKYKPVDPWDALPREPSSKATVFSLKPDQREKGKFILPDKAVKNLNVEKSSLKVGDKFNGRLDIPAYNRFDTWIVAGTSTAEKGVTHYAKAIHYKGVDNKPVRFLASQKTSEKIGTGEAGKTGYATVSGEIKDLDVEEIRNQAAKFLNDPEWTQVGFDPRRQGGFYVRNQKNKHVPVREADEVIQIGPLVLAKNAKLDLKHKGFNEGGVAMNRQMEMAFMQQGGLKDDGMKVDPVSGNEIPPGSLAKEVRDDIPAQLSEGEYVVPADVVQYYGVKHFEDLRDKAKGGLQQMERDGRIGGEPVPAGGPKAGPAGQMMKQQPPPMPPKPPVTSGMTQAPMPPAPKQMAMGGPLTAEEMQEIRKMANGGMVQMADPYQQQKAMYQQPQGMSLGGSPFIPNIGTGFSWEATGPGSITPQPPKQVTLYGPNGEVENLILPADQTKYDTLIAQGYTETAPVTPMFTSSRSKDDSPEPPKPKPWYETTDFTAGTAGGKASAAKYFGAEGKIGSVVGGIAGSIFGGPVGGAIGSYGIKVSNLATARAEVTLRKAMGDTNGANALQKAIDNQLKTSKALGYADDAIDAVFGSDGDMKVISALQAAGIKVDRSLRDDDLDDFMDNLSSNDKDKLIDRYGDKKTTPIVSTPKSEKSTPTEDTSGDPRGEPDRDDRPRPPSPPEESTGGGGGGSTSGGGVSSGSGGGSYGGREDTSGFGGSTGVPGGRNKGGLMQRK